MAVVNFDELRKALVCTCNFLFISRIFRTLHQAISVQNYAKSQNKPILLYKYYGKYCISLLFIFIQVLQYQRNQIRKKTVKGTCGFQTGCPPNVTYVVTLEFQRIATFTHQCFDTVGVSTKFCSPIFPWLVISELDTRINVPAWQYLYEQTANRLAQVIYFIFY